jgi:solute carrier family 25 carnitine/acylcarnitine transporter 20/29
MSHTELYHIIDMVKNRYMTQPDVHPRLFPTPTLVARHVYNTEGLKGFYRGKPC